MDPTPHSAPHTKSDKSSNGALDMCATLKRRRQRSPPPLFSALAATHRFAVGFLRTVAGHDLDPRPDEKKEKFRNCKEKRSLTLLFAFGAGSRPAFATFCVRPRGCCSPPELAAGQEAGGKSAAWGRWCRIDLLDLKTRVASAAKGPRCDKLLPDELHGQLERTERRLLRLSLSSIYGRRVRLQRTVGARQVIHLAADNLS